MFFIGGKAIENGEHIGELGDLCVQASVLKGVEEGVVLIAPKGLSDFFAKGSGKGGVVRKADRAGKPLRTLCHDFERLEEENLFEAERAPLVHGKVSPVHKDPVVGLALGHAIGIGTAEHIVHQRHHLWPHFADKGKVTRIVIVVGDGLKPVERIVHDGVDMGGDGVFSAQLSDGALHTFAVEVQVVVHQVRLNGVTAPHPAVALNPVTEEFAGRQVKGIGADIPDTVQLIVGTAERPALLRIKKRIFVIHRHIAKVGIVLLHDISISEGLTTGTHSVLRKGRENIQGLTVFFVKCLLAAFTIVDADVALQTFHFQVAKGLASKVIERAVADFLTADW